ncbi:MAG: winged helix-turn-helix domain-containing protein [Chloroflexi bacterium]|nr:winged helix-turn-helix domain-containing protein [Chloroflexota bacterium]
MANLTEVIQDLADLAKRGAITEEELRRLLGYIVDHNPASPISPMNGTASVDTGEPVPMDSSGPRRQTGRQQRRFLRRGAYGKINVRLGEDLVLVTLLELGGAATRPQILERITQNWGLEFTPADHEILPGNGEQRWSKACNWSMHNLDRDGLIERPRRGLQSLTERGKLEAETRRNKF